MTLMQLLNAFIMWCRQSSFPFISQIQHFQTSERSHTSVVLQKRVLLADELHCFRKKYTLTVKDKASNSALTAPYLCGNPRNSEKLLTAQLKNNFCPEAPVET